MNKNNKNGKKVIGIAMAVILIASIFATFTPAFGYKRPVDAPAGGAIYYMSPQDSTVPGSFCNVTEVQIHVNSTQDLTAGYVTLTYNSSCANITGFTAGTTWTAASGTWVSPGVYFIDFEYTPSGMPTNVTADDYHIGNVTIHCNSTTYCKTDLTFNYTACAGGSFCTDLWAVGVPHITPLATENGTFMCCLPGIEVAKTVYNPDTDEWVETITTGLDENVTFRGLVHAGSCCNLTNVVVTDVLPDCLEYINGSAKVNGNPCEPEEKVYNGDTILKWYYNASNVNSTPMERIEKCNWSALNVTFEAKTLVYGTNVNKMNASGWCNETDEPDVQVFSEYDEATVIKRPPITKNVYLVPQHSNASYCNNATVEVWVNGSDMFQSGQINLTYDSCEPSCVGGCANVTNWELNADMFPHGDWDSSKCGEEWITFARNDMINGKYRVGTLTIHCCNETNGEYKPCNTTLHFVRKGETARYSALFNNEMIEINHTWTDGSFKCLSPDLNVSEIIMNAEAPKYYGRYRCRDLAFSNETNNISATIVNDGDADAGPFNVYFAVGSTELCVVPVPEGLDANSSTEVWCNVWKPTSLGNYTVNVTADINNSVKESDEGNNTRLRVIPVHNNGYKGNRYTGRKDIETEQIEGQGTINLRYAVCDADYYIKQAGTQHSFGEGQTYLSGTTNWAVYKADWNETMLPIPPGATIEKGRLYVYHSWGKYDHPSGSSFDYGVYPDFNMSFNGGANVTMADALAYTDYNYTDRKGFGTYDYPYGMLAYNVTDSVTEAFMLGQQNSATLYNLKAFPNQTTMQGMVLLVVYNHSNELERLIYINEGFDMLGAYDHFCVDPTEATAYATFNVTEDIGKFARANLITIGTSIKEKTKTSLYFNDKEWEGGLYGQKQTPGEGWTPSEYKYSYMEFGANETDVIVALKQGENIAKFQDRGDLIYMSNAILKLEKGKKKIVMIDPAEKIVQPQDQFDLDVVVDPYNGTVNGLMVDVYAVQYTLKYNASVLKAESQIEGDFLKQDGNKTIVVNNKIDHPNGIVQFAVTRKKTDTGVFHRGTLSTIQFTTIGEPGAESDIIFTEVILIDSDKQENTFKDIREGKVKIFNNTPPIIECVGSKHEKNNAQKKFECWTTLCVNVTDDDKLKGWNISYLRWSFGDGQYGTAEGGLPCDGHSGTCCFCKDHSYISWQYNASGRVAPRPNHHGLPHIVKYDPFVAMVTVTDDGCVPRSATEFFDVWVFMTGDANGDAKVDILDAVWIGKHFGETCDGEQQDTCCGYMWNTNQKSGADLNNDCTVNILDAVIVGTMWGHTAY